MRGEKKPTTQLHLQTVHGLINLALGIPSVSGSHLFIQSLFRMRSTQASDQPLVM